MQESKNFQEKPIYSVLAHIYDTLMQDVNYEAWADYMNEVFQKHSPDARNILELACGTGTLALLLDELHDYKITATDASESMVQKARDKALIKGSSVDFQTMNFLDIKIGETYDIVYMVFDSLNYLLTEKEILELHDQVSKILKRGGYFIYDFTTPRNSRKAIEYLHNEEGTSPDHYRYYRSSDFDPGANIHTNEFEIEKLDKKHKTIENRYLEIHRQKIYTLQQIKDIVIKTGFTTSSIYNGFSLKKATEKSLRITMVLQW